MSEQTDYVMLKVPRVCLEYGATRLIITSSTLEEYKAQANEEIERIKKESEKSIFEYVLDWLETVITTFDILKSVEETLQNERQLLLKHIKNLTRK